MQSSRLTRSGLALVAALLLAAGAAQATGEEIRPADPGKGAAPAGPDGDTAKDKKPAEAPACGSNEPGAGVNTIEEIVAGQTTVDEFLAAAAARATDESRKKAPAPRKIPGAR